MGLRNILIEGVSGTGKTSVCDELLRRGYQAIHGDRVLAYQGDPVTGAPLDGFGHAHHIWDVAKVSSLVADHRNAQTFFCGGSRNFARFIHLFDLVFVLEVDAETLIKRLDTRPKDEFGGNLDEQVFIMHLHATGSDVPSNAISIDAAMPLIKVVDEILARCLRIAT